MTAITRKLTITLKSDLCAASGDGFSSGIDTDICYGDDGFPYIPGRRLKGCMREVAEALFDKQDERIAERLFGEEPKDGWSLGGSSATVWVGDAHLAHRDDVAFAGLSPAERLGSLTKLRAQTAVDENGRAKEDTLRFVRVVRHYAPEVARESFENGELCFEADILLEEEARDLLPALKDAARALRNIGYRRNVGFGAVSCTISEPEEGRGGLALGQCRVPNLPDGMEAVSFKVRFDGPVMVPGSSGGESLSHIPGQAVMGFFAGRIWRRLVHENPDTAQENFDRLILSRDTESSAPFFSPLYPVDSTGARCTPAPSTIAKIKGGERDGRYVNLLEFEPVRGETPKPLRSGFVGSDFLPVEVSEKIEYHHSIRGETLYTQRCLCEGQEFSGFVSGGEELLGMVREILVEGDLRFGRSKSAQYARCTLVGMSDGIAPNGECSASADAERLAAPASVSYELTPAFVIQLDSDVLIPDGKGGFSADVSLLGQEALEVFGLIDSAVVLLPCGSTGLTQAPREIGEAVSRDLGTRGIRALDKLLRGTYVQMRNIAGFNAKWSQTKPQVTAFAAGSCLVVVPRPGYRLDALAHKDGRLAFVGSRRSEGFGCVRLLSADAMIPATRDETSSGDALAITGDSFMPCISYARTVNLKDLNPSFLNRIICMAEESGCLEELFVERGGFGQPADDPKANGDRIGSIKDKGKRELARKLIADFESEPGIPDPVDDWSGFKEHLAFMLTFLKYRLKADRLKAAFEAQEVGNGN